VACGGFCGTLARYLLAQSLQNWLGNGWPYDILAINLIGAFVLALISALAEARHLIGPTRRLFINVGFLGAFTTFSSLALGDYLLFSAGQWWPALLYIFASLWGGLLAALLGDGAGIWLAGQRRTTFEPTAALEVAPQTEQREPDDLVAR
jgi:CrcB protein